MFEWDLFKTLNHLWSLVWLNSGNKCISCCCRCCCYVITLWLRKKSIIWAHRFNTRILKAYKIIKTLGVWKCSSYNLCLTSFPFTLDETKNVLKIIILIIKSNRWRHCLPVWRRPVLEGSTHLDSHVGLVHVQRNPLALAFPSGPPIAKN